MTVQQTPVVGTESRVTVRPSDASGRFTLVASALALCAATLAVLLVWTPWGERNAFAYRDVAPVRDAAWNSLLVDALAFAGLAVTFAILTCLLVRERGRLAATIGAVLAVAGGILFAAGEVAVATLDWYATSDGISPDAGAKLLSWSHADTANGHSGHLFGPQAAGFVLVAIASLVLAGALIRARALPTAVPVAVIVMTLAQFPLSSGRLGDLVEAVTMLTFVGVALAALRGRR